MADTFSVTTHPTRGRCAVATKALRPGDLILAEPTLAFAINDALVRKRCAVTGCDTTDMTCEECANVEHFCDAVAVVLFVFAFLARYIIRVAARHGAALADQGVVDGERERRLREDQVSRAQRVYGDGAAATRGVGCYFESGHRCAD